MQALPQRGQHRGHAGAAMDALQGQHVAHPRRSSSASSGQRASAWARSCWAEKSTVAGTARMSAGISARPPGRGSRSGCPATAAKVCRRSR
ncbi:hypothetical protein G6F59_017223 [Rhizopus arrhizus]|nr:hypothetical protein G6F59_017223 [Rhizopus arrhizus]